MKVYAVFQMTGKSSAPHCEEGVFLAAFADPEKAEHFARGMHFSHVLPSNTTSKFSDLECVEERDMATHERVSRAFFVEDSLGNRIMWDIRVLDVDFVSLVRAQQALGGTYMAKGLFEL
jgi:hypothetical protein